MELLSDAVFGDGMSIPGAEDISVLCDERGFPYYKGSTFKGIFREELVRYLKWTQKKNEDKSGESRSVEGGNVKSKRAEDERAIEEKVKRILGGNGNNDVLNDRKVVFSDFTLSHYLKKKVIEEIGDKPAIVQECFTNLRTFTEIEDTGVVKDGSLRMLRCVNKGLCFYSDISCAAEDEELVEKVFSFIKWIGTMRNKGFGKIKISVIRGKKNA